MRSKSKYQLMVRREGLPNLNWVFPSEVRHPLSPDDSEQTVQPDGPADMLERSRPAHHLLLLRDVEGAEVGRHHHLVLGVRLQLVELEMIRGIACHCQLFAAGNQLRTCHVGVDLRCPNFSVVSILTHV